MSYRQMGQEYRILAEADVEHEHSGTVTPAGWHHHEMERHHHANNDDDGSGNACAPSADAKCTCGPAPLIVAANCKLVTYNACTNAFECSAT